MVWLVRVLVGGKYCQKTKPAREDLSVCGYSLLRGDSRSCGCLDRELSAQRLTRHGMAKKNGRHRLYNVWRGIRERCNSVKHHAYSRYGGRGISVCDEWNDYAIFYTWCIGNGYVHGLQIDRIDNEKGYSPDNCRFVSPRENCLNRSLVTAANTSGFCGVSRRNTGHGIKRFTSIITVDGKVKFLGVFLTARQAAVARDSYIMSEGLGYVLNLPELQFNAPV